MRSGEERGSTEGPDREEVVVGEEEQEVVTEGMVVEEDVVETVVVEEEREEVTEAMVVEEEVVVIEDEQEDVTEAMVLETVVMEEEREVVTEGTVVVETVVMEEAVTAVTRAGWLTTVCRTAGVGTEGEEPGGGGDSQTETKHVIGHRQTEKLPASCGG